MALVAQIVKIEAPSVAYPGGTVIVDVHVKNLGLAPGGYNDIKATGVFDSSSLSWQFDYLNVAPQETVVFRGWFTMPSKKVGVTVTSWYWDGSEWQEEDSAIVDIAPTGAFSEFSVTGFQKV